MRLRSLRASTIIAALCGLANACAQGAAAPDDEPLIDAPCGIDTADCSSPGAEGALSSTVAPLLETAIVETPQGVREVTYEVRNGLAVTEGDIVLGDAAELVSADKGAGIQSRGERWPDRVVPFVINGGLPASTVTDINNAIAHWETNTDIDFVARNGHRDYIEFVNSNECSSWVGRRGNRQTVNLTTGKGVGSIIGMAIAKSDDMVYSWYDDGMASGGSSTVLDTDRPQYPFSFPPGRSAANLLAVAINTDDRTYSWYTDGTFAIGSTSDLDRHQAPRSFSLPPGYTVAQIVGMDFNSGGRVYTWYSDGRRSVGTPSDLDAHIAPASFSTAPGMAATDIVGIGISASDRVYAWYDNGQMSAGSSTDLDSAIGLRDYDTPGHCGFGSIVHELGHAIGLWHEQSRCDRDSNVIINLANVQAGQAHNFNKQCDGARDLAAYDIGSIMHYGSFAFSKDNMSPTITRLNGTTFAANRAGLSANDIQSVRELYGYTPADGQNTGSIIGIGIAADDDVYVWHSDGRVTAGRSYDHDDVLGARNFSVASGKTRNQIIAIDISASDRVYTWYSDGTVSEGSSTDLDSVRAPRAFSLPAGKTVAMIVGIAIDASDRVYYYYNDRTVSVGSSTNASSRSAPFSYSVAAGKNTGMIVEIGIAKVGSGFYAWYNDSTLSAGQSNDLDTIQAAW